LPGAWPAKSGREVADERREAGNEGREGGDMMVKAEKGLGAVE